MKRLRIIIAAILLSGLVTGVKAQNFGYQYSGYHYTGYNERMNYRIPSRVHRIVNRYYGFQWVNTARIQNGHRLLFVITLRRENRFVELTMNQNGKLIGERKYRMSGNPWQKGYYYRSYYDRNAAFNQKGYVYSSRDDNWHNNWNTSGITGKGRNRH